MQERPMPEVNEIVKLAYISVSKYEEKVIHFWRRERIWVVHDIWMQAFQKECMKTLLNVHKCHPKLMFPSYYFGDEAIYIFNYFSSCDSNWIVSRKSYIEKRVEKRMVVVWLYLMLSYFVCVSFRWRGSLVRGCAQGTDWEVPNSKKKGRSA